MPQTLILMTGGAFALGWILAAVNARLAENKRALRRDPRDDRIRSLEAELRVTQADLGEARTTLEGLQGDFKAVQDGNEKRDAVISDQQVRLGETTRNLRESVLKTRELRAELSNRAAESIRSEVKLREVETELSVSQASTDMIATGVLDYSLSPGYKNDGENDGESDATDDASDPDVSKTAT